MQSCDYNLCKAKEEIERLISGHKSLYSKQDVIEAHYSELLNLYAKLSSNVATLTNRLDMQDKDREDKHHSILEIINKINKTLDVHTKEEMEKFEEISKTFSRIEIAMVKDKADSTIQANETKLFNDKITWKVIGLASFVSTILGAIGTWIWSKI